MKVIFLDVDGVLNRFCTKETIEGYLGIEDQFVQRLKELIEATEAKVVLTSTWRRGWYCYDHSLYKKESERQDIRMFETLKNKLFKFGIELLDYTEDFGLRGEEIDKWLSEWKGEEIESFVILDDMDGAELRPHAQYLVQTSLTEGFTEKHLKKAIHILNEP